VRHLAYVASIDSGFAARLGLGAEKVRAARTRLASLTPTATPEDVGALVREIHRRAGRNSTSSRTTRDPTLQR